MRIVHVQTTIHTVFGVLDDDGNVAPQQPITAQVSKFSADSFTDAHAAIAAKRDEILEHTASTNGSHG